MTIILIEQDEIVCEAIRFLLQQDGHTVIQTESTEGALGVAAAEQIDLVLCDISIAVREADAYTTMWNTFSNKDIPVIIIAIEDDDNIPPVIPKPEINQFLNELNKQEIKVEGNRPERIEEGISVSAGIIPDDVTI